VDYIPLFTLCWLSLWHKILRRKKAEPRTPHFLSLNQDIVSWSQGEKCGLKHVTHSPENQPELQLARPFTPSAMNCIAREASKTPNSLLNMLLIVCPTNLANVFENKKQIKVIK
jgi:hypothetical protein